MNDYNPASLAYLGDAVFELLVRSKNIREHNVKSGRLHKDTVKIVNAGTQAKMAEAMISILNENEASVYKRGRNASVNSAPKNAKPADYCKATGLEAVFGYLYLKEKSDRIAELFEFCMKVADEEN